jgi:putative membrane protein
MKENKGVTAGIWVFSVVVFCLVVALREIPKPDFRPAFTYYQPLLHAVLNGSVFVLLFASLFAVKNKNIGLHKKLNTTAMIFSLVFLLSYVVYHYFSPETKYGGDFIMLYLAILASHVFLAAVSLPFILLAYYRGLLGLIDKHKKLVRITYPIWLYVAFTGVLVYVFLSPYYA